VNILHHGCLSIGIVLDISVSITGLRFKLETTYKGEDYDISK
jgi:hypothetical protein